MNQAQITKSKNEVERSMRAYQLGLIPKEILENKLNCLWVDIFLTLNINDVKHGKFNIIVNEVI